MPIASAALIALLYVVVATGEPDDTGIASLVAIVLTTLVIVGSAMTYSRLERGASTRFLGALAVTSVLFVIATMLDVVAPALALVIVAPLVAITVIDALSRRTSGQ